MGRMSPGPSWARRRCSLLAAGAPLVAISSLMHDSCNIGVRSSARTVTMSFPRHTNSKGLGTLHLAALRALQDIGRIEAAGKDGDEGVVTGTARVRYRDARRGRFEKRASAVRFTFSFRSGRHGATRLVLAASSRAPMAAGWTPVQSGGIARVASQAPAQ